jgi:hypothetical protein
MLRSTANPAGLELFVTKLGEGQQQSGWRPIETAPRHGNYVRVYVEEGVLFCPNGGEATHWMKLPEPPNESDK